MAAKKGGAGRVQIAKSRREAAPTLVRKIEGQSVVEFLLILPVLLTILMLIIKTNTVIQMQIVDQKYARAQALFVAGNSANYPMRGGAVSELSSKGMNALIIGVSEHQPADNNGNGGTDNGPTTASTYFIGRKTTLPSNDSPGDAITQRYNVRVRNTISICTPMIAIGTQPVLDNSQPGSATYNFPEDPKAWQFCNSTIGPII